MNTNKFIKMCKASEDLQRAWDVHKKPMYDWIYFYDEKDKKYKIRLCTGLHAQLLYYIEHGKGYSSYEESIYIDFKKSVVKQLDRFTYLPTLEQLFEMVWKIENEHTFAHNFNFFRFEKENKIGLVVTCNNNYTQEYLSDSFKGCLLQYIIEEDYNKIWTGEKWYKK